MVEPRPYPTPITLSRGLRPVRGLLYSLLIHEVLFSGALFLSARGFLSNSPPDDEQVQIIDLRKDHTLYLPTLSSTAGDDEKRNTPDKAEQAEQAGKGTKGLSYPGKQNIVSDVPNPTNHFQSLLQPELIDPPTIRTPIMLPNMVQMTNAGPQLPQPKAPPAREPAKIAALEQPDPTVAPPRPGALTMPTLPALPQMQAAAPPNVVPNEVKRLEQLGPVVARSSSTASLMAPAPVPQMQATAPPNVVPNEVKQLEQLGPVVARSSSTAPLLTPAPVLQMRATAPPTAAPGEIRQVAQLDPAAPVRFTSVIPINNAPAIEMHATPPPKAAPGEVRQLERPDAAAPVRLGQTTSMPPVINGAPITEMRASAPPKAAPGEIRAIDGPATTASAQAPVQRVAPVQPITAPMPKLSPTAPPTAVPGAIASVAAPSEVAATTSAPKRAPVPTTGPDSRNLLSVSPLPPPPGQEVRVPVGEARGRVALSTDPNLNAPSGTLGGKVDSSNSTTPGLGRTDTGPVAMAANATKTTSNRDDNDPKHANGANPAGTNGTPATNGSTSGPGRGAAPTPGPVSTSSPFAGITIQGGRLEPSDTRGLTSPGIITITQPGAPPPRATAYNMTIVATAGSGGGLPDLGVFSHEPVYTVYVDVKPTSDAAAKLWILQYAILGNSPQPSSIIGIDARGQEGVTPPFAIVKDYPQLPADLLQKHAQRQIILYAVIDTNGKLKDMVVKQTPDSQLNAPVLAAMAKWTFRPAESDGKPVAAKILLGIPLAP
jgi:hypothetical protein